MHMVFATVCAFFFFFKERRSWCPIGSVLRVVVSPECLMMMMQIRLPLLNGLLGVLWTPCRSALLPSC